MPDVDMRVELAGVTLKNPVCVASGTFGFGREYGAFYDLGELGAICAKGLTLHRREGNPGPRIAETPMGILNSVGLQNPGVDAFVETELPFLRQYDVKVIANISGNTPEEYGIMCEKLAQAGVDLIEVNISCPNVKAGGLAYGTRPELAAEVTQVAKAHAGSVPVMVKLSPNVTDITEIARAVAGAGADALSLINTLRGMRIDVNTRHPVLKMNTGGLSGPAVLPVAVRMVWEVAQVSAPPKTRSVTRMALSAPMASASRSTSAAFGRPMVSTVTSAPYLSFSRSAASRPALSSGFMIASIAARFSVPSGLNCTPPFVSGTCFIQTTIFTVLTLLLSQ